MRTRLAALIAAVALVITFSPGVASADVCPNGSNWDNVIGKCR